SPSPWREGHRPVRSGFERRSGRPGACLAKCPPRFPPHPGSKCILFIFRVQYCAHRHPLVDCMHTPQIGKASADTIRLAFLFLWPLGRDASVAGRAGSSAPDAVDLPGSAWLSSKESFPMSQPVSHDSAISHSSVDAAVSEDLAALEAIRQRVLWLSTSMIHHANRVRPNPTGLKVGGH